MLLTLLLLALVGPPKAELTLHVLGHGTRRGVIGMVPMQLTVWARLHDPRREFECPSFEWEFGDGDRSSRLDMSCDPFAPNYKHPTEYRTDPMRHTYRVGGEHRLKVTVRAGKRERTEYRDVLAVGPSLEDFR